MSDPRFHVLDAVEHGEDGELNDYEALTDLQELESILGLIIDYYYGSSKEVEDALWEAKENIRKAISLIRKTF